MKNVGDGSSERRDAEVIRELRAASLARWLREVAQRARRRDLTVAWLVCFGAAGLLGVLIVLQRQDAVPARIESGGTDEACHRYVMAAKALQSRLDRELEYARTDTERQRLRQQAALELKSAKDEASAGGCSLAADRWRTLNSVSDSAPPIKPGRQLPCGGDPPVLDTP